MSSSTPAPLWTPPINESVELTQWAYFFDQFCNPPIYVPSINRVISILSPVSPWSFSSVVDPDPVGSASFWIWIRIHWPDLIRIRIRIHWPDWIRIQSGSETQVKTCIFTLCQRELHPVGGAAAGSLPGRGEQGCTRDSSPPSWVRLQPESIEWFIEDEVFSSSYDLAPK